MSLAYAGVLGPMVMRLQDHHLLQLHLHQHCASMSSQLRQKDSSDINTGVRPATRPFYR